MSTAIRIGDQLPREGLRRVSPAIWSMREFAELPAATKLVLLYLSTAPSTAIIGLASVHVATLAAVCGITKSAAATGLAKLDQLGFIDYDPEASQVWVRGHLERQLGNFPDANPTKWGARTYSALQTLPETALVAALRAHYSIAARDSGNAHRKAKRRSATAQKRGNTDRVSDRVPDTYHTLSVLLESGSDSEREPADTPAAAAATPTRARRAGGAA